MCVYDGCLFYVCVWLCGSVICCVAVVVEDSGFLSLGVLNNVVCLCKGECVCCICNVRRGSVGARV